MNDPTMQAFSPGVPQYRSGLATTSTCGRWSALRQGRPRECGLLFGSAL